MSKQTMSGSEMLAHLRNRHEQKHLKEKLDELAHSEFLVRDTSRVETHRWRQFLRENHRSTGWSPMAMRPEIPTEGDSACADSTDATGSTPRRRYDLQAIKKYQRPWACTLRTGDSHNKVYRELAEAGQSSQKSLYTPRQATLALMGIASFARGRTWGNQPRLAQTVPAVVGLERARSAWVSSGRRQLKHGDDDDNPINPRQALQSAPMAGERKQRKRDKEFDPKARVQFEHQGSALDMEEIAKTGLQNEEDDTFTLSRERSLKLKNMSQSVMALKGLRKSVDYWKCHMCGGDKRPMLGLNNDKEESKSCANSFYDTSVALKGLHRAKTILDGLLYRETFSYDNSTSTNVSSDCQEPSEEQQRCVCSPSQSGHAKTSTEPTPKHCDKHNKNQNQQKTLEKKTPGSSKTKSEKKEPQTKADPKPKTMAISRRKGVVGRPKGLFEHCNGMHENGMIKDERPPTNQIELNRAREGVSSKEMDSPSTHLTSFINNTEGQDMIRSEEIVNTRKPNLVSQRANVKDENTTTTETLNEKNKDSYTDMDYKTSFESSGESQVLDSPASGLSREDNDKPLRRFLTNDARMGIDQRDDPVDLPANPLREDQHVPSKSKITATGGKSRFEIIKSGLEESQELRDTFDTNTVGKPRSRHLSTVKRRKFSFMSTAVSAFVSKPSSDDLRKNVCSSRVRSYSVTSQASLDSVATSADGNESQSGPKGSKWQLENIICASNLARYAGRATRNENGEISYTRPWRQKKKKVSRMEVNVFYSIARFMLKKQKDLRSEKEARKNLSKEKDEGGELLKKIGEEKGNSTQPLLGKSYTGFEESKSVTMNCMKDESLINGKYLKNIAHPISSSNELSTNSFSKVPASKEISPSVKVTVQPPQSIRKTTRASISVPNTSKRDNANRRKSNVRAGSAVTSSTDPIEIPNLASIIGPSKAPINLTNGVLDYDDDLSTITSGIMLIPGRKQVRYKGILLRNYVSPQDRYKIEPRMRHKKPTSIRWSSKEGAIVMAHSAAGGEAAAKTVNVVFPKQARKKALAKMVDDNHSQPVDHSARVANAELRAKIDQFLQSVEPFCRTRQKTALF
ncbi:hypothetical protein EGW08_009734 [Elysia chlorotica]|uniref:Uncharacterized protein n=1 Tax=Elysia chlorotica TaxID=188477 RepID=A0A433TLQ4_ELYCH|nr:hypothetical protein EGW08_009734 [Elysia chlorotica]